MKNATFRKLIGREQPFNIGWINRKQPQVAAWYLNCYPIVSSPAAMNIHSLGAFF